MWVVMFRYDVLKEERVAPFNSSNKKTTSIPEYSELDEGGVLVVLLQYRVVGYSVLLDRKIDS